MSASTYRLVPQEISHFGVSPLDCHLERSVAALILGVCSGAGSDEMPGDVRSPEFGCEMKRRPPAVISGIDIGMVADERIQHLYVAGFNRQVQDSRSC